jgi:hypothetical protein
MTDTQTSPPRGALADGLSQGLDALLYIRDLTVNLGDETTVATSHTLTVKSAAEVDGFASGAGVEPGWAGRAYRAARTEGTATVTVEFNAGPDDAAAIEVPGRAA